MSEKLWTTGEVARRFEVSPATIWRWCNTGTVKNFIIVGKDQRLIPDSEVDRLTKEFNKGE